MKRSNLIAPAVTALALAITLTLAAPRPSRALQGTAIDLYKSLTPDQRKSAVLKFEDKAKSEIKFPGGKRAGIQVKDLDEKQRDMVTNLITLFTSDYGKKKCDEIAKQPRNDFMNYYVAFFGEPGEGKTYAWRIAEHHLTLIDMQVENGEPTVFGPILLGADPGNLWDEDEDKMIALYNSLSEADKAKICKQGKSDSGKPIGDAGAKISELSEPAQAKVKDVFQQRLDFFSPDIQQRIKNIVEKDGGLNSMNIVFYGEATKRCAADGKWDFKLGTGNFLCDYENTRASTIDASKGHIHLSMIASEKN